MDTREKSIKLIKHLREQNADRVNADNVLIEVALFSSPSAASGFATMPAQKKRMA